MLKKVKKKISKYNVWKFKFPNEKKVALYHDLYNDLSFDILSFSDETNADSVFDD